MKIIIKKAIKNYDNNNFVLNIKNLILQKGIYAVLGVNGSGKTSFLNCLSGINNFDQLEIIDKNNILNNTSIMLQNKYIFNGSVLDNITISLSSKKFLELKDIVDEWLIKFKLIKYKNKNAKLLSAGEKAKIIFLRTIISSPKILILDEPVNNIDIISKKNIFEFIKEFFQKNNNIILFSTHNFNEIEKIVSHIIIFNNGKIIASGEKKFILNKQNILINKILSFK